MVSLLKMIPGLGIDECTGVKRSLVLAHLPIVYMMNVNDTFNPD